MKSLLLVFLLSACTDDTSIFYKRDVRIVFEGQEHLGVAVLPQRAKYNLEMTFAGQLDLFTFRSCHREITQEDAGGGTIFGKKNKVSFTYQPVNPIETDRMCAVEIEGYEQEKGRHSWGFIDFATPLEKLDAVLLCNGTRRRFEGISICQSLSGLLQQIIFSKRVIGYSSDDCPKPLTANGKVFDIKPAKGRCVYSFREIEGEKDWHRLTTIGYEEIMVRKVN